MREVIESVRVALGGHPLVNQDHGESNPSRYILWEDPGRNVAKKEDLPSESGLIQAVLVEARVKADVDPVEGRQLVTMLGDFLSTASPIDDYPDLAPFSMRCVHPGRTLIEKITIFSEPRSIAMLTAERMVKKDRHLFDIHMLLADERALNLIRDRDFFDKTVPEHIAYSKKEFKQDLHRPSGGVHEMWIYNSPEADAILTPAIETMLDQLYYGDPNDRPTWTQMRARVHEAGEQGLL